MQDELMAFLPKAPIWRFRCVWVSIWGYYSGFEKRWISPGETTIGRKLISFTMINLIRKKRTSEFVAEIQAATDSDNSKSIYSIDRDLGPLSLSPSLSISLSVYIYIYVLVNCLNGIPTFVSYSKQIFLYIWFLSEWLAGNVFKRVAAHLFAHS